MLEKNSKTHIASLANLLEQRNSVIGAQKSGDLLSTQFPDLHSRLLVKLSNEMDMKTNLLKESW